MTAKKAGRSAVSRRKASADQTSVPVTADKSLLEDQPRWITVTLRASTGKQYRIRSSPKLQSHAMQLSYVASNRRRWTATDNARKQLYERSEDYLEELGIGPEKLREIAQAEVVEVSVPWVHNREDIGWEARLLPWEFLLSTATKRYRGGRPFLVIRHLDRQGEPPPEPRQIERTLAIESTPAPFGDSFSFEAERRLLEAHLGFPIEPLKNPTLKTLGEEVKGRKPDVIHIAGIDTHHGARLLGWSEQKAEEVRDGLFLADENGAAGAVEAWRLARVLCRSARPAPVLVVCDFYNSAARTAALIVAEGAQAAIGFQDDIDDTVSENFFATFYYLWKEYQWDLLKALRGTWQLLASQPGKMRGTGVVLWSATSLLEKARGERQRKTEPQDDPVKQLLSKRKEGEQCPVTSDLVQVEIEVCDKVNYSLLHNNRGIFNSFKIRYFGQQRIGGVRVEVVLYAGSQELPYVTTFALDEPVVDLAEQVRVPLTSALARSLRESVRTILSVKVCAGEQVLHEDTYRVTLLPIDEWKDDDRERYWMPSFVLPRDPGVARIVDSAQRYLMALKDDGNAGFDGYQSGGEGDAGIDLQVQAIWAALSYDHPLSYINPPPTFTAMSQRLRTPSDVLDGRRGTCIDLALLVAACLEYVDIYPVVFLLSGHAFPGYWRSEESYERFLKVVPVAYKDDLIGHSLESWPDGQAYPWTLPQSLYREVIALVRTGDLVPLESVWLTQHKGFRQAMEDGLQNLSNKNEFNCMVDVKLAREWDVTPLPISIAAEL